MNEKVRSRRARDSNFRTRVERGRREVPSRVDRDKTEVGWQNVVVLLELVRVNESILTLIRRVLLLLQEN